MQVHREAVLTHTDQVPSCPALGSWERSSFCQHGWCPYACSHMTWTHIPVYSEVITTGQCGKHRQGLLIPFLVTLLCGELCRIPPWNKSLLHLGKKQKSEREWCALIWSTEKNAASFLLHFYQRCIIWTQVWENIRQIQVDGHSKRTVTFKSVKVMQIKCVSLLLLPQQSTTGWVVSVTKSYFLTLWRSEVQNQGIRGFGFTLRPLSLACSWLPSPYIFTWSFFCVCACQCPNFLFF